MSLHATKMLRYRGCALMRSPLDVGCGSSSAAARQVEWGATRCRCLWQQSRAPHPRSPPPARAPLSAPDFLGYRRFPRQRSSFFSFTPQGARGRRALVVGGAMLAMGYVCTLEEVPVTGRYHSLLLTVGAERALGTQTFETVKRDAAANRRLLSPNDPRSRRVRRVGKRIAVAVERLRRRQAALRGRTVAHRHLRDLQWEFIIIDSNDINAFVVPGGKVAVFTGLLNRCRSDDELATVIGHEAAHVIARHTNENISAGAVFTALKIMIMLMLDFSLLGSAAVSVLFELPMSRRNETEADRIGLELMTDACFDPRAASRVYAMLGQGGAELKQAKFLSTHPHSDERVADIQKLLPQTLERFEQRCGRHRDMFLRHRDRDIDMVTARL